MRPGAAWRSGASPAIGRRRPGRAALTAVALVGLAACAPSGAPTFLTDHNGGPTTARELRGRPFNQAARNLTNAQLGRFAAGAEPFDQMFTAADGLGPDFNQPGCLSCHRDGAVRVSAVDATVPPGFLVRVSQPGSAPNGGPLAEPTYGLQLQTRTTDGSDPEASISLRWATVAGHYPDGSPYSLRRPVLGVTTHRGPLDPYHWTSIRTAPTMIGLGLLEAIPAASLESAATHEPAGISGRVNRVVDAVTGQAALGRFGWKAGQASVAAQTVTALREDMGITTDGPSPEMDARTLSDLVFYNRTIAVPISRGTDRPAVQRGAQQFVQSGCASCHTTTQRTGDDEIAALSNITFHPYTDLLLHDMGAGLADGRTEFAASGREWRTAPLWGLSRRTEVTGTGSFLHDGRARTIEEAVLWHGGEAAAARRAFELLPPERRADVLAFLGSL